MHIQIGARTDVGRMRTNNEDNFKVVPEINLFVLADGMGGYNAGEVASGIAVKTITNLVREAFIAQELDGSDKSTGLHRPSIILRDAIQRANKIIYQTARSQAQCEGMGTTVVAALVSGDTLTIGSAGDSRCYLMRDGVLTQITRDQTMAQELVDQGVLSHSTAFDSRWAHVLSSSIGGQQTAPVVTRMDQDWDNVYLLCSDGLTKHVPDARIAERLGAMTSSRQACEALLQDALDAGGSDNVTVIVVRLGKPPSRLGGFLRRLVAARRLVDLALAGQPRARARRPPPHQAAVRRHHQRHVQPPRARAPFAPRSSPRSNTAAWPG